MSVTGISTSAIPMQQRQALQPLTRRLPHVGGHQVQTQANGLPKSALSPSNTAKTGKTMAGATSKHILDLRL